MTEKKEPSRNTEQCTNQIEKMEEYLSSKKAIFDFIINRNVRKTILLWFTAVSIVLLLGGSAYIEHRITHRIEETMSEKIDEEVTYLRDRNKITELGDLAISTGEIKYSEKLRKYLASKKQKRIYSAAQAELSRIESFFSGPGYELWKMNDVEYTSPDGKVIKGLTIPPKPLMKMFQETSQVEDKSTILVMLSYQKKEGIPEFFLEVGLNTNYLRMRYVAFSCLQRVLHDFSTDPYDCGQNEELWEKNKEDFYKTVKN